jgi:hypothetical protein
MMTKQNADIKDRRGIMRALRVRLSRRSATYQNGAAPAYNVAQVVGLK